MKKVMDYAIKKLTKHLLHNTFTFNRSYHKHKNSNCVKGQQQKQSISEGFQREDPTKCLTQTCTLVYLSNSNLLVKSKHVEVQVQVRRCQCRWAQ